MVSAEKLAFSLPNLARALDVSTVFLRLEIKRGKLRPTRVGRRIIIKREDIIAYLGGSSEQVLR
jgi:excisionase family DNA binding protein